MVGGTTHNQHQSLMFAPPSSTTAPTTSPEDDEILKRNTDCVYFLASPLTCKKGSECEYRHSDIARVNPRDCFYWLNGNCLNPKCAFRHPPLDGLQGADVAPPVGPSVPAPHLASYVMPKQGVACIFFQKGFCLKGHLCPFLHGPQNPINNKPSQSGSSNPIPDPSKTGFPFPEKPVQEQKLAKHTTSQKAAPFSASNGAVDKKVARVIPPPVMNEPTSNKPNHSSVYRGYHVSESDKIANMKDSEEYSREPSPGFDVIVDNEVEESEYSREKGEFGRSRGGHDYDHFNERESRFDVDRVDRLERRPYSRNTRENESDLRYRISKQKKSFDNGLTSVVSHEYGLKNHVSRHHRQDHRQDHCHDHRHDHRQDQGNLSSRLRGRIKIPGRSISPTNENNTRVEREFDVERRHLSLNQNRLRDRNHRIKVQRDIMSDNNDSNFFGPKRLAELKKHQSNDEQSLGKRKYPKTEDSLSFEGPKPLSEILKRKRGINNNNNNNNNICVSSVNIEEKEILPAIKEEHNSVTVDIEDKAVDGESVNYGTSEVEKEEGVIDEDELVDEQLEAYDDENGGEYEYEQMEGEEEDYNLDEGEYVAEEEEVVGDEYGKKDSVVYS